MGGVEKKSKQLNLDEKYFRMVKHMEHHWGIYLAGAWYLGPPCLCTYLMGSGWLVPSFILKDSMHLFFQVLKLCPRLLYIWDNFPSDWLIFGVPVEPQLPVTNLNWNTHVGFTPGSLKFLCLRLAPCTPMDLWPFGWFTPFTNAPGSGFVFFFFATPKNEEPSLA